jgi:hypothetical protein
LKFAGRPRVADNIQIYETPPLKPSLILPNKQD